MKKVYETPELYVDEYAADTMIASSETGELTDWEKMGGIGTSPKNGNADSNQNCWGCDQIPGFPNPNNRENACMGADFSDGVFC